MGKLVLILLMLSFTLPNPDIVAHIESGGNDYAVGDNGKSFGALQIQEGCLQDVNNYYGTNFKVSDMQDYEKAKQVFELYLNYGAELFCKKYGRYPTEEELVRMWNGGIYAGYKYQATEKYWKKYLQERNVRTWTNEVLNAFLETKGIDFFKEEKYFIDALKMFTLLFATKMEWKIKGNKMYVYKNGKLYMSGRKQVVIAVLINSKYPDYIKKELQK